MSHAYQIHKQDAAYFLTMTAIEWIDILMRAEHKQIICDSLNFCVEQKRLEIYAYVIMSSHLHLIASAKNGNLSDVVRDFKKFTSSRLIKDIKEGKESRRDWMLKIINEGGEKQIKKSVHQIWQYNNHTEEVFSPEFTLSKIKYIHNNPVVAGLVSRPEHYFYSSAMDYSGQREPVTISTLALHNLF